MKTVRLALVILVASTASAAASAPTRLTCEPQIYFLLGMMSGEKARGEWERFFTNEAESARIFDEVAKLVYSYVSSSGEFVGRPVAEKDWREAVTRLLDSYFTDDRGEHGTSLFLDAEDVVVRARRSSSTGAYLTGALLRLSTGRTLSLRKALFVAKLLSTTTDQGVYVRTPVGFVGGGSSLEFERNRLVQRVMEKWKDYLVPPEERLGRFSKMDREDRAEFKFTISTQEAGEIGKAISFELDHREIGFGGAS